MYPDQELSELMQSIALKGLEFLSRLKEQPSQVPTLIETLLEFSKGLQSMFAALLKNPEKFWQMQLNYSQDAQGLLQEQFEYWLNGERMPIEDKRFCHKAWQENPFFNLLSQHYMLASEHIKTLTASLDYGDPQLAKRIHFFCRQYLDALSPGNFLYTNPQVLAETIQSHGKNLLRGLNNFLADMEHGDASRLMIRMTDTKAFQIGGNIAATPGKVIYKNPLIELIQYTPQTQKVHSVPLLIVPPWINKFYILDLSPHNSLIRWLVAQGITVFVISWINPNVSHANFGIERYLNEGPISALKIIKKQLRVRRVNALGFCIGGTLLSMLLAYNQAKADRTVRSATFLATMIDFSDPGEIGIFIDEQQLIAIEKKMSETGYLDGQLMYNTFNSLRASDLIWSFFIRNYLQGQTPVPFDVLYWNADSTNMPEKMHSQYLRWMYLQNDLIKPGKIRLNQTPLDVNQIDLPTFFVSTQKDHIAPWKTTYLGFQRMKGEKQFLLGGSGHIAGIIIPPGSEKYGFYLNPASDEASADDWLSKATHHSGSWWPTWFRWLKKQSGRKIDAPELIKLPYQTISEAPGHYVKTLGKCSMINGP